MKSANARRATGAARLLVHYSLASSARHAARTLVLDSLASCPHHTPPRPGTLPWRVLGGRDATKGPASASLHGLASPCLPHFTGGTKRTVMRLHQMAAEARPIAGLLEEERFLKPEPALTSPVPACEDPAGQRLFLSDSANNRILIVSAKTGRVLQTIGSGEPGLLDGACGVAKMRCPAGSVYDPASDTLLFVDALNRAVRSISLHDHRVTTLHPVQDLPPPPPSPLARVWARLQYILFLKEAPPGIEAIPGLPQYYRTPRAVLLGASRGADEANHNHVHSRAEGGGAPSAADVEGPGEDQDTALGTRRRPPGPGTAAGAGSQEPGPESTAGGAGDFNPWHIALRPDGSILVADCGCTRVWHIDPASPGTASLVHDTAVQEEAWASSQSGRDREGAGDGAVGWLVRGPALSGTDLLGLPPSWKIPAEPANSRRFREVTGPGAPAAPSQDPQGLIQGGMKAEDAAAQAFQFKARIRPGRHEARLHVALPQEWALAEGSPAEPPADVASAGPREAPTAVRQGQIPEAPSAVRRGRIPEACAWVQCRGSAVELSVLGARLRQRRVSWGQEWMEELNAERLMGTGEYENHADVAGDQGGRADVAEHSSQPETSVTSVDGEGKGPPGLRDLLYIDLAIDASMGTAQVIVDAALYFSRTHYSRGVRSPGNLVVQRLHCCINLDVAPGEGTLPSFLCTLQGA